MENRCPNCGVINPLGVSSCSDCRRDLSLPLARADAPPQAEAQPQREADGAATPGPDHPIALNASRINYVVIAVLATTYGVVLGVFWICFFTTGGRVEPDITTNVLFAAAPITLIVTGFALYGLHAGTSRRAHAAVATIVTFTAILLAAKAVLGMHWLQSTPGWEIIPMVFVVIPGGVSALLLGLTAIWLGVGLRK